METKKENQPTYTVAENIVLDNAENMLDTCSGNILATEKAISQAWLIQVQKDKSVENTNPFVNFIDMLQFYIDQAKNKYAHYCQDHNIVKTKEQKELVKNIKPSGNAKVEPIIQIKQLKME